MAAFDPTAPFVLLDDARRGGRAELFSRPTAIIEVTTPDAVRPALQRLREATAAGQWAAGFISFEAGYALEPKLLPRFRPPQDGLPLLWFGLFERRSLLEAAEVEALLGDGRASVGKLTPRVDAAAHAAMVEDAQRLIAAGDIYQANITFQADVAVDGHPLALYRRLRGAQAAPYGALVHTGSVWALSFSPELFFTLAAAKLTARPMKGTAARSPTDDAAVAAALAADEKNRAENLMIVDLLRNDLSRVAAPASVEVDALFEVETYPTVHQMTSTISATLGEGHDAVAVIEALYPCGSVTGAPKIRAMEVIADIEPAPRGLYTGSIGRLSPNGDAVFNVAIRTLVLSDGEATLGLGSGIVADSEPAAEWAECLAKAAFLTRAPRRFDLIETLRFDAEDGLVRFAAHVDRLSRSAKHWGFRFDRHALLNQVQATVGELAWDARIRLLLAPDGTTTVQASPLPTHPAGPVEVALRPLPVEVSDPRLFHKTTDRGFYDEARAASGAFEAIFVNAAGQVTEGSFTNLFVKRNGKLLTPPRSAGLLPGILRAELLASSEAIEVDLTPADLAEGFFIGNSLRGLISATLRA
ncbi:aminodeoxychorismate synthase component I [Sphingoaurantiacus capsulatus]|uniref:Probable branched-chain-amino-acid aminotransferase n=1 Tax=Sphingoaurantiacus capsulatus TaxID=1771310 RepID=A0ABV7XFS1_9SPHN